MMMTKNPIPPPSGSARIKYLKVQNLRALREVGLKKLKTCGSQGPLSVQIKYREPGYPLITCHLVIDERDGVPMVMEEWLSWTRGKGGQPFRFVEYRKGQGRAASGALPVEQDKRVEIPLNAPDLLAVNALGQFA